MQGTQILVEKAIRLHLAARKRSQVWLAEQLGVSQFWVGRRMTGSVRFNVDDLDRIASIFDTTVDRLIEDAAALDTKEDAAA